MQLRKLKELVHKLGGLLVLDGDEPAFVVLSYDKYQKIDAGSLRQSENDASEEALASGRNGWDSLVVANGVGDDGNTVEKLNQEILALKEEIRQKEEAELVGNEQSTEAVAELVDLD